MSIDQHEASQRLWEAVLTQALEDCFKRTERDQVWYEAYDWLRKQDDTFVAVCIASGVAPDLIGPTVKSHLELIKA